MLYLYDAKITAWTVKIKKTKVDPIWIDEKYTEIHTLIEASQIFF